MLLRRTALAIGSLALLGGLAACDLPGSTPPVISRDVQPNDTQDDAPLIPVGRVIHGTVDGHDTVDWYKLAVPLEGDRVNVACLATSPATVEAVLYANGEVRDLRHVDCADGPGSLTLNWPLDPGVEVWIQVNPNALDTQATYAFRATIVPNTGG